MTIQDPIDVLLVEDDPGDVLLVQEAFADRYDDGRLHVVGDGVAAMEFLRRDGEHADAPRPSLVLLDLNLPRRSGRGVLADIKSDADLRDIPVVVLTTSTLDDDIAESYRGPANAYVAKPLDFSRFTAAVQAIDDFYTRLAVLPPGGQRDPT